jgi:hypothetical protein
VLRELANPNLHDINLANTFKIELWDRQGQFAHGHCSILQYHGRRRGI